jgi:hypothetical protein
VLPRCSRDYLGLRSTVGDQSRQRAESLCGGARWRRRARVWAAVAGRDGGRRGPQGGLKGGAPGISACGPGLTRGAGSSAEQGRWEKVAAGKTEGLTVGPCCQRASGNGERAACGKGAADVRAQVSAREAGARGTRRWRGGREYWAGRFERAVRKLTGCAWERAKGGGVGLLTGRAGERNWAARSGLPGLGY